MSDHFTNFLNKKIEQNASLQNSAFQGYLKKKRAESRLWSVFLSTFIFGVLHYFDWSIFLILGVIFFKSVLLTAFLYTKKNRALILFLIIGPIDFNKINIIRVLKFHKANIARSHIYNFLALAYFLQLVVFIKTNYGWFWTISYGISSILYAVFLQKIWIEKVRSNISGLKKIIRDDNFFIETFGKYIAYTKTKNRTFFNLRNRWRILIIPFKSLVFTLIFALSFIGSLNISKYFISSENNFFFLYVFLIFTVFLKFIVEPELIKLHDKFINSSTFYFSTIFFRGSSIESELLFKRCIQPIFGFIGKAIILTSERYQDHSEVNKFRRHELEKKHRKAEGYVPYYMRQQGIFIKQPGVEFLMPLPNYPFFLNLFSKGSKFHCKNHNWRKVVSTKLKKVDFAVLYLNSDSENFVWECQKVSEELLNNRIILIAQKNKELPEIPNFNIPDYTLIRFRNNYFGRYLLLCKLCLKFYKVKL